MGKATFTLFNTRNILLNIESVMTLKQATELLSRIVGDLGAASSQHLQPGSPDWGLSITDALNAATKRGQKGLYKSKVAAINASLTLGCKGGWAEQSVGELPVLVLHTPTAGVARFHLKPADVKLVKGDLPDWNTPWSGVQRQIFAIRALEDAALFKLLAQYTQPGQLICDQFRNEIRNHSEWKLLPGVGSMG